MYIVLIFIVEFYFYSKKYTLKNVHRPENVLRVYKDGSSEQWLKFYEVSNWKNTVFHNNLWKNLNKHFLKWINAYCVYFYNEI